MPANITYLEAIALVLKDADRPLNAQEIVREIRNRQIVEIAGKTPWNTVNARISEDIKRKGQNSLFKRVVYQLGRGRYTFYTLRERSGTEYTKRYGKRISYEDTVLVFPAEMLDTLGHFHGIRRDFERFANEVLDPRNSFPMPRIEAEANQNYKQIVSYVIVKYKDSILRFTRGVISAAGQYFHGQYSIGFGGHLELKEWDYWGLFGKSDYGYRDSVIRELAEEINISPFDISPHNFRMIGVLNDDSTALGRCHFAFIHVLELPALPADQGFRKREKKSITDPRFIPIPMLATEFSGYEYWSKLCIQTYFGERLAIDCYIHPTPKFSLKEQAEALLITGYIGSGKTEACSLLVNEFGYKLVPCSHILQQIIGCGPIEQIGRRRLQNAGYQFIKEEGGHEKLAQGIVKFMNDHEGSRFVLDGLRYPQTLEVLKDLVSSPITVIYVESTIDNLFQYYKTRESERHSFAEFLDIVNHPVEREIERFYPLADITIYNHGSLESYIDRLRDFFRKELG